MSQLHFLPDDKLSYGLLIEDARQRLTFVDQYFLKIFDIREPLGDLAGKTSLEIFEQSSHRLADRRHFMALVEKIIHMREFITSEKIILTDGQQFEFDVIPIKNDEKHQGNMWYFRKIFTKLGLNYPAGDEKLLQFIMDNCSDGFWDWNLKTNDVFCSDQWKKMFGYQENEVEGSNLMEKWLNKVHPDDKTKISRDMNAYLSGKTSVYQNEHRLLCKNGKYKWTYTKAKAIQWDSEGNPSRMIGILVDISARKKLEESLSKSLLKEKKLNELKSQFMSMALHEFRTPLGTMLVMADSLEAYWEKMSKKKIVQKIKCIRSNIEFLTSIMEKVLNLSLTDLGKIKFSPTVLDFNDFLTKTIKEKKEKPCLSHNIKLYIPSNSVFVKIDKQLMKEVIFNVISNSIKYSPKNTAVNIELDITGSEVIVSIADQGKGIHEEEADRIFEPFFRGRNVEKVRGTGLGLALSRQFVRLHGGDITFKSQVNTGTTFFISLPKVHK